MTKINFVPLKEPSSTGVFLLFERHSIYFFPVLTLAVRGLGRLPHGLSLPTPCVDH